MGNLEVEYEECEICQGSGRIYEGDEVDDWAWCPACDGTGELELEVPDLDE